MPTYEHADGTREVTVAGSTRDRELAAQIDQAPDPVPDPDPEPDPDDPAED